MGLLDSLKKKELAEIEQLKTYITGLRNKATESINQLKAQLERYRAIIDIEAEVARQKQVLDQTINEKKVQIKKLEEDLNILNSKYQGSLSTYTKLRKEVNIFESKLDLMEFGVYEPVYDFEKSDDYRAEQNRIIALEESMISNDTAAKCNTQLTVQGSESKEKAVVRVYKKLMLRAFNGECDGLVAKVKWNNINQMMERMLTMFEDVNKLGRRFKVYLNIQYLDLKRKELILEHEYQTKRQQEKEKMLAIQEEQIDEEKAMRELEQAQREAEKEEAMYQTALDSARQEMEQTTGEKHDALRSQIQTLVQELKEALEKKERAVSMAKQAKRGYVYVVSNIGSFGENVYKIGMTRRLEPLDRVKELSDASVPFQFDTHAVIYSDEARTLESELHKAFINRKVNMLNYRKDFFNVTIDEIEQKVKEIGLDAKFSKLPEAMEYRKTQAILDKLSTSAEHKTVEELIADEFPGSLTE